MKVTVTRLRSSPRQCEEVDDEGFKCPSNAVAMFFVADKRLGSAPWYYCADHLYQNLAAARDEDAVINDVRSRK